MTSVELSLAAAGSAYLLIFGARHVFSLRAAPATAGYLPLAATPAATDNHVDEADAQDPEEKDRIREQRATRDAATAAETLRLRRLIRNLLAFQLPVLAASVALAVGSLVLALHRGEEATAIGTEAAAAVSWVSAVGRSWVRAGRRGSVPRWTVKISIIEDIRGCRAQLVTEMIGQRSPKRRARRVSMCPMAISPDRPRRSLLLYFCPSSSSRPAPSPQIFAIAVTYFHFHVLAAAAPEDTRAPSPVNLSIFYFAYLAVAALNLRNTPSGGERIILISQVIISAYLLFTDSALLYIDTRADEFAATLERNAQGRVVCPEISAGVISRYTYSYVTPLLEEAVNVPLEQQDIWDLNPIDDAANIEVGFRKIR
ncbi:hypothetical protein BDK51DRAFT_45375 [Blyttiomyces helicus]|uniref:Uncharacterized protein n=1 Tax=Blyttiomyces helicus TaxID=388810 RepID=A0A4P9VTR4_9FUNG|nr:hypothetical protein BDK51DRAFT_45375 [Blyttiomyces helicus]|eukprot:RKO82931.1 hypothetical protein BDK51DRAFT_45375 [Blyttiomyces helicus]